MKKFGSKRELIGLVIVLVLAAAGFAFFAWYTMRPADTIATISFGIVLAALIGIVLLLDAAARTRWRRFWIDLLFAGLMLALIDYYFLDVTAPWQMLVTGAGLAVVLVALLAIRKIDE
ncbi:hypothetical protein [Lacticaseibacillus rhamnosus]|uniref:hypothetical protein n=1 Tax=Lacticaseibacillus rhamnosus TaxID=47715 RepID=UPI00291697B4|nr:hypothetical protein [Lacticaseibacillus rhamnosus]WNX06634.1 hypothetical protein RWA21_03050 [Lacticaseibacillus rhamnosus]